MKQIRRGAFETNSSSMHSITIATSGELLDSLNVVDGVVTLYPGEFGWEIEEYNDAATKAVYCWQDSEGDEFKRDMLEEVILEQTGAGKLEVQDTGDEWSPYGYIDHQSEGTSYEAFSSKETLRQFIFNPNSVLYTDNDNH